MENGTNGRTEPMSYGETVLRASMDAAKQHFDNPHLGEEMVMTIASLVNVVADMFHVKPDDVLQDLDDYVKTLRGVKCKQ